MRRPRPIFISALPLLVLGAGCDLRPASNTQDSSPTTGQRPAAQTFETMVRTVSDAELIPPSAVIGSDSPSSEAVVVAFDSREQPERILAWYRDPHRDFSIGSELQEGAERVLTGSTREPSRNFTVRLAPGGNGGTSGVVLFTER